MTKFNTSFACFSVTQTMLKIGTRTPVDDERKTFYLITTCTSKIEITKLHFKMHSQRHSATVNVPDAKFLQATVEKEIPATDNSPTGIRWKEAQTGSRVRRGRRPPQATAALQLPFTFVRSLLTSPTGSQHLLRSDVVLTFLSWPAVPG